MYFDTLFLVALQSALFLGLIHGVNPCGHSWVVLAPFVVAEERPGRVAGLTGAFILGTTLGCLAIGLLLGLLATSLPDSARVAADLATAGILMVLGAVLLWRPQLLHSHGHDHCHPHGLDHDPDHDPDHDHGHDQEHGHEHGHDHHSHDHHDHAHPAHHHAHHAHPGQGGFLRGRAATAWGLGLLGFVNMIVPCPTVAILYSYGLNAASPSKAVAVFGVYALATGAALAGVIFAIYKVTGLMRRLQKPWVEPMVLRLAGLMTLGFGGYSLYMGLSA